LKISGARGHLITEASSQEVLMTRDLAANKALVRSILIKDEIAQMELFLSGRIFRVPAGTPILIINTSWDLSEVRFLDGQHVARTGWTLDRYIQITTAAPR